MTRPTEIFRNVFRFLLKITEKFDVSTGSESRRLNAVFCLGLIGIIVLVSLFVQKTFTVAERKEFWRDETHAFEVAVRAQSFPSLLLKGAPGQGSPAPLDYMLLRGWYLLREPLNSLGLSSNVYFRMNSISAMALSALFFSLSLLWRGRRSGDNVLVYLIQTLLIAVAVYFFLFFRDNPHFAVEMRPYALWNSLWFLSLFYFMRQGKCTVTLLVLFCLTAMTATASFFQLSAFALSLLLVRIMYHREKIRSVAVRAAKYMVLPFCIALYYVLIRSINFSLQDLGDHSSEFFRFWLSKEWVPILSAAGIVLAWILKDQRGHMTVFLSMLLLYFMAPVILWITVRKGFFFSSRQYLYFDLIYPLFLVSVSFQLPEMYRVLKRKFICDET